jgi:hypothetical protein
MSDRTTSKFEGSVANHLEIRIGENLFFLELITDALLTSQNHALADAFLMIPVPRSRGRGRSATPTSYKMSPAVIIIA